MGWLRITVAGIETPDDGAGGGKRMVKANGAFTDQWFFYISH